jgi:putative acetyltransferase
VPAMPLSPDLTIRRAVDEDGPRLAALIAGIFADYPGVLFLPEEFPELLAPATAFAARGGLLLVGEAGDGRILASFGLALTHEPATAEFLKVYLHPSLRGRGIASRLMATALDHARRAGARRISLWSDALFVEGHRFYARNGFRRGPGIRALHDASATLEINFVLDPIPSASPGARAA